MRGGAYRVSDFSGVTIWRSQSGVTSASSSPAGEIPSTVEMEQRAGVQGSAGHVSSKADADSLVVAPTPVSAVETFRALGQRSQSKTLERHRPIGAREAHRTLGELVEESRCDGRGCCSCCCSCYFSYYYYCCCSSSSSCSCCCCMLVLGSTCLRERLTLLQDKEVFGLSGLAVAVVVVVAAVVSVIVVVAIVVVA
ncbi:unnamed protein product [Polarella glacialis]|uniref:Transmembrane protein n=1 Tax=Polarella glacialis TaxID=89957 RepID=A0A813EZX2_POLGL|nr:unnamed protein product [Polarella glacialis]